MVKNTKGGNSFKRLKKNPSRDRELIFRENDQEYSRIIKQLGDGRFECQIFNVGSETNVVGKICGSMKKKVWVNVGDVVLVSKRSFISASSVSGCCDIIHKYTPDEALSLKSYKEIPQNVNLQATALDLATGNLECGDEDVEFDDI